MRNQENSRRQASSRRNDYVKFPITGTLPKWSMEGYVQGYSEYEKGQLDWVRFCVNNKPGDTFYTIFSISVPWDVAELDAGDHVIMTGSIRTWQKDSGFALELVAETCEVVNDDEQTTTGRRGA